MDSDSVNLGSNPSPPANDFADVSSLFAGLGLRSWERSWEILFPFHARDANFQLTDRARCKFAIAAQVVGIEMTHYVISRERIAEVHNNPVLHHGCGECYC